MKGLYRRRPNYQKDTVRRHAGYRPPAWLTKRLRRHHPDVQLMWSPKDCRWVLVQTDQHPLHVITVLETPDGEFMAPNLDNTVGYLDTISLANFRTRYDTAQWMANNLTDELPDDPEQERRIEDNIGEFSERAWHLTGRSVSVVPDPKEN